MQLTEGDATTAAQLAEPAASLWQAWADEAAARAAGKVLPVACPACLLLLHSFSAALCCIRLCAGMSSVQASPAEANFVVSTFDLVQVAAPEEQQDTALQKLLASVAAEHNRRIAAGANGASRPGHSGPGPAMAPVAPR